MLKSSSDGDVFPVGFTFSSRSVGLLGGSFDALTAT